VALGPPCTAHDSSISKQNEQSGGVGKPTTFGVHVQPSRHASGELSSPPCSPDDAGAGSVGAASACIDGAGELHVEPPDCLGDD